MKLNKIMKVAIVMILLAIVTIFVSQMVSAYNPANANLDTMFTSSKDESGASEAAGKMIGMIINIAQVIGTGVAIIMLIVLAIKYIAASPEGKADIKKNATIYIVGAVILFAASGILAIIRRFAVKSIGETGTNVDKG